MSGFASESTRRALRARDADRRAEANPVVVRQLKKDGTPSKMHDAVSRYRTVEEAAAKIAYWRSVNPGRTLRYSIDGVEA